MIAVVVLFLLTSVKAQNVRAENELQKDTSVIMSKSTPPLPSSRLKNLGSDKKAGKIDYLNWSSEKYGICLTPGCHKAAAEVLKKMDKHTDPCDNFYEFACGNFLKKTKTPDDQEDVDLFTKIRDKIAEQLKVIIEEPSSDDEARPFRMVKDLYKSCMDKSKNNALEKVKEMTSHIAYPDELLDDSKLEDYYRKLEISQGNFLEAFLSINKFDSDFSFGRLKKPVNKTEWIDHGDITGVNAFYFCQENSFQLLAGIMQGAFLSYDRPSYMNYGAIGFITGHEITHGFDDEGRQFDKDGNLFDWWASEAKDTYLRKAACIIDQYRNYTVEQVEMLLDGINTQGENIADNGGIKLAYRAYNRWVAEHGTEKRLPGLQDFTPQQMFWISAANTWCSKDSPETLKNQIKTDEHSPAEFRVLGSLSNSPEFAKDFKCPPGSKMNPIHKCTLW